MSAMPESPVTQGEAPVRPDARELLRLQGLTMDFTRTSGLFARRHTTVHAVREVDLTIAQGQTLGLVGESGSGKTTLGRCILRTHRPISGHIWYTEESGERVDLAALSPGELRRYRTQIRMIFQDPNSSLNPRLTVNQILAEPLVVNKMGSRREIAARVARMLELVGLRPDQGARYPHAFSGGERQRIGIGRALITHPRLVVCDEAVTALDVSIRSQVLNLLGDLQDELGLTYLFISHDLGVIKHLCDQVAVMYVGELVEQAGAEELFRTPRHPYTQTLLESLPVPDPRVRGRSRGRVTGEVPDPSAVPSGCVFHPRCPHATERCSVEVPVQREIEGRQVRCHHAEDLTLQGVPGIHRSTDRPA